MSDKAQDYRKLLDKIGVALETAKVEGNIVAPRESCAERLAEVATEAAACSRCELCQSRTNSVFGSGNPESGLVFVGEAPGKDEDLQGLPFVGRSGKLLTKIIASIGFEREDVYICNVLKCRPPKNRDPSPQEKELCEEYLIRQLAIMNPKIICALGTHAAQTLLRTKTPISKLRGEVHYYHNIPLIPTFHPAALLHRPQLKRDTWEDMKKIRAMYDELTGSK